MNVLIVAEHHQNQLHNTTRHVVSAAKQLSTEAKIDVLVTGFNCQQVVDAACDLDTVEQVLVAENEKLQQHIAENIAEVINSLAQDYQYIMAPATTFGKNIMPRVAAQLNTCQISDLTEIISADTFVRPIYAGNAYAKVKSTAKCKVMTVRATAFPAVENSSTKKAIIKKIATSIDVTSANFVQHELTQSKRPELTEARIVVAGGRGLQCRENFTLLESLADKLNAAIGASRAAVDAGYVSNDCQVGQTGKVVAPELYIAIGISGAVQHVAGMKASKVIVAINKDPDAPIFQVADYGLVGDLFAILPQLEVELDNVL